jgi:serine O-acetyltransferase
VTHPHLGESLPPLVEHIVDSYLSDDRIHCIDKEFLPSRDAAARICDLLLELSYPGYFGRQGLTRHNIAYHVGELVPRLWEELLAVITQSLRHRDECHEDRPENPRSSAADAAELATGFVERIPDVRARLAADVQAHYDGDPAATGTSEILLAYPGMLAISLYRYAHELHTLGVPYVPRIMTEHAHRLTGIDIHPGARIGRSFCIDHGTGVVIGETTDIGDNVKLYQGVTLGALSFPKDERGRLIRGQKRHPTIGNGVTIYANATVLGGDTIIGDGSVIGGGVFLTRSVAPGHVVSVAPPLLRVRPPRESSEALEQQPLDYAI